MRKYVAVAALAMLILSAASLRAEEGKSKVDGTWSIESFTQHGTKMPAEALKKMKLVVAGEKVSFLADGKEVDSAKLMVDDKNWDTESAGKKELGIYKLDGDTLTICSGEAGDPRPANYESTEASKSTLVVLKKDK